MSHERDDEARKRRLEALRALSATSAPSDTLHAAPVAPGGSNEGATTEPAPNLAAMAPATTPEALAGVVVRAPKRRQNARRGLLASPWLRGGLALLAVCVVAGGVLLWLRRLPPPKSIPDPISVVFNSATMGCPQSAAWSPDGKNVAVLGYVTCGAPDNSNVGSQGQVLSFPNTGGTLLLYDATSGHLDANIALDTATDAVVPQKVLSDPNVMRYVALNFDQLIWSPNGRQIAIRFSAGSTTLQNGQFATTSYGQGLLLVTAASHDIKLLPQPAPPQFNYPGSSFDAVPIARWDLSSGTSSYGSLPQALAYRWNADGTLAPTLALPTNATALAPQAPQGAVGNPDGGKAFTVLQSGYANFGQICSSPNDPTIQPVCCPVTSYVNGGFWTSSPAWSPDGRYLIIPYGFGIGAMGKFPAPAGTPAPPSSPGCPLPGQDESTNLVNLPTRDAAMAAIVRDLVPVVVYSQQGPSFSASGVSSAQFVWSPDGRRVIVTEQDNGPQLPSAPQFSLYDTATGKQSASFTAARLVALGHLPTNELSSGQSVSFSVMVWSPDSQHLLLLDNSDHFMLLLGAKSLKG